MHSLVFQRFKWNCVRASGFGTAVGVEFSFLGHREYSSSS